MSAPPEVVDDYSPSDENQHAVENVPPAVVAPHSDAAARNDAGEEDVEPDAAELLIAGESSGSASLMAPSFELNNGPVSPEPESSVGKGDSSDSAATVPPAPGILFCFSPPQTSSSTDPCF